MNKKVLTLPFLASLFLLNTGFTFKPKLRAFTCGDYYHLAKSNQELLKRQEELLIFDTNGKAYQYDYASKKVSPEKFRAVGGGNLNLEKSYLEGTKFYLDYYVMMDNIPATMQFVLDYESKTLFGTTSVYGITQYIDTVECKEIEFPKNTKFEY